MKKTYVAITLAVIAVALWTAFHPIQSSGETATAEPLAAPTGIPKGTIVAWFAKAGPIPAGWAICDGTNNTPNIIGRYIRGIGGLPNMGVLGGTDKHSHSIDFRTQNAADASDGWNSDGMNQQKAPQTTGTQHTHRVQGSTGESDWLPPHVNLIYLMKL